MYLPDISPRGVNRKTVSVFGGYDRRPVIPDGSFRNMETMTADNLPTASPRPPRGTVSMAGEGAITGLAAALGAPAVTRGSDIVFGGEATDLGLAEGEKTIVPMGAYLIVFPDGKYINTADRSDRGSLGATARYVPGEYNGTVRVTICDENGSTVYPTRSSTAPQSPSPGDRWVDTSETPSTLKKYYGDGAGWVTEPFRQRFYFRGLLPDLPFRVGEFLEMTPSVTHMDSGAAQNPENVASGRVKVISISVQAFAVEGGGDAEFIADGFDITLERKIPDMDFVTEAGNRLWGCKYGVVDGALVNEIYASALGDFKSWYVFEGVSTDSYAASVGTDGPFTGAVNYRGRPVFFKEGAIHRVPGSDPSNFRVLTALQSGVAKGSENSLCAVGGLLFYNSPSGVAAYDGSTARIVSEALCERLSLASGGEYRGKYYVSGKGEGGFSLFVYDVQRRTWHREDSTRAARFVSVGGETYFYRPGDGILLSVGGGGDEKVRWSVESGDLGIGKPFLRTPRKLTVRMRLTPGSRASFYVSRDGGGWEAAGSAAGCRDIFPVPLRTGRCSSYRYRIEGEGDARIYSVTETAEGGANSDRT